MKVFNNPLGLKIFTVFIFLLSAINSFDVQADSSLQYRYKAYSVDLDADGILDIYLKSQPKIIFVSDDPITPININNLPNYYLKGTTNIGNYQSAVIWSGPVPSLDTLPELNILAGNLDGDQATTELLIQAATSNTNTVVLALSGETPTTIVQEINLSKVGIHDISAASSQLSLANINNDGIDDIIVTRNSNNLRTSIISSLNLGLVTYKDSGLPPAAETVSTIYPIDIKEGNYPASLQGNFNVSGGNAGYTLPIENPPGMGGMEPAISLNYNSQSGNGLVGVGWNIGGLSQVSRCPTTILQDASVDPVDFDANDKFCLDGVRLVPVSGNSGDNGTIYKTEKESFYKIESIGGTNNDPSYFIVYTKSGQKKTYGQTPDSRAEAQGRTDGKASIWAINEVEDTVGNYLTYSYTEDLANGSLRISRVDYTGNKNNALSTFSSVRFVFEARPDIIYNYQSGSIVNVTQRLKSIKTYFGEQVVKNYSIDYNVSGNTKRSRVNNISECDGAGANCKLATIFRWSDTFVSNTSIIGGQLSPTNFAVNGREYSRLIGEFNGDGISDILWSYSGADGAYAYTALGNGDGSFAAATGGQLTTYNFNTNQRVFSDMTGDFNGDGITDLVWSYSGSDGLIAYTALGKGDGTFNTATGRQLSAIALNNEYSSITGDFNGDGNSDLGWSYSGINGAIVYISLGRGDGAFDNANGSTLSSVNFAYNSRVFSNLSGDVNADGVTDLIWSYIGADGAIVYTSIANGAGGFNTATGGQLSAINFTVDGKKFSTLVGDYNGDGVSDLVWSSSGSTGSYAYTALGKGNGSFADIKGWQVSINNFSYNGRVYSNTSGDFNGDGYTDLAWTYIGADGAIGVTALGKGDGTFADATGKQLSESNFNISTRVYSDVTGDFNGDGLTDFAWSYSGSDGGYAYTSLNTASHSDLITTIQTSLGNKINISYKPLTDPSVYTKYANADSTSGIYDVISATNVVDSYDTPDGIGGVQKFSYQYEGMKVSRLGRGNLGFYKETMTSVNTGFKSVTIKHQDYPLEGNVLSNTTTTAAGVVISSVTNNWNHFVKIIGTNGFPVYQMQLLNSNSYSQEINTGLTVKESNNTTVYDPEFNSVKQVTIDTLDGYKTVTDNTYITMSLPGGWVVPRLKSSTVTNTIPGNITSVRTSSFDYDLVTGLLTKEVIEPGHPSLELVTTTTHDAYGNKETITTSGPGIVPRSVTSSYVAGTVGTLTPQTNTTNALGHSEIKTYDARYGTTTSLTGPNGLTTTWSHDSFGKTLKETRADGGYSTSSTSLCVSNCSYNAPFVITSQSFGNNGAAAGPASKTYLDKLGREIVQTGTNFNGQTICRTTAYDSNGRVAKQSIPFVGGSSSSCSLTNAPAYSYVEYDILGRVLKTTHANGRIDTASYNGNTTSSISDVNGAAQTKTQIKNSRDKLIKVIDHLGSKIDYIYDAYGNLNKVIDNVGNTTVMTYNVRGHKIAMNDPDMGSWSYDYNTLGELVKQTDARGNVSQMVYDKLGRLKQRTEPQGTGTLTTSWAYDTAANGIGKLASESNSDGFSRIPTYDSYGRIINTQTTIQSTNLNSNDAQIFNSSVSYDPIFGRVTESSLPGKEVTGQPTVPFKVYNTYDANGYLTEVRNAANNQLYWQLNTVNERGQTTQETYGNNVVLNQSFTNTTGLVDTIATAGSGGVQNLKYTFDALGNLKTRNDYILNATETSSYDKLNRLTGVNVVGLLPTQNYSNSFLYDTIGNIKYKSDLADVAGNGNYTYRTDGVRPHAVTQAGTTTYSYDNNGNLTSDSTGRVLTYTAFNKPATVTRGSTLNNYYYGTARTRVKKVSTKAGNTTTTWYLGKAFEKATFTDKTYTEYRYYVAAGSATVLVTERSNNIDETLYLHKDHIGSTDVITDALGDIVEFNSFDAWGKRRKGNWEKDKSFITAITSKTTRGFTGHEMDEEIGLVNMNARMYDPLLGRFLTPDTVIQYPSSTQGYNRYTYVNNNPLSFTDPSGHFGFRSFVRAVSKVVSAGKKLAGAIANAGVKVFKAAVDTTEKVFRATIYKLHKYVNGKIKEFFMRNEWARTVGSMAASYFGGPWGYAAFQAQMVKWSGGSFSDIAKTVVMSYVSAYVTSGSDSGFSVSRSTAVAGGIYGAIGSNISNPVLQVLAHGAVGGLMSVARGGKFDDGFKSGAVGKLVTVGTRGTGLGHTGRFAAAVISGGLAAEAGGGKFSDGATTAAFGYLFNEMVSQSSEKIHAKGQHDYEHMSDLSCTIGSPGCTASNLVASIHRVGAYPGQNMPLDPNGGYQYRELPSLIPGDIFTVDPIYSLTTSTGVVNVTTPNHLLHPGFVKRDVIQSGNALKIRTVGGGWGRHGRLNNKRVEKLWGDVNKKVFNNLN